MIEDAQAGWEGAHRKMAERILREHPDELVVNRCPECDAVARTPQARICLECLHFWGEGSVSRDYPADMRETACRVRDAIARTFGLRREILLDGVHLLHDLGMDSLDTIELVFEIEEEFGIDVPDDSLDAIESVGDVIEAVHERRAGDGGRQHRGSPASEG